MGSERRKHRRVSVSVEVNVKSGHNFYAGRTRDVSAGGLFIETTIGIELGAMVQVSLMLDKQRFSLKSEVMWVLTDEAGQTSGVGVRFLDLNARATAAIERFMRTRAPDGLDVESDLPPPPMPLPQPLPHPPSAPRPARKGPPPLPI
jgi:uncharacterized protein (TIGR02266 family)